MTMTLDQKRQNWIVIGAGAFVLFLAFLGAVVVTQTMPNEAQRNFAGSSTVWAMHACFFVGAIGLALLAPAVATLLGRRRAIIAAILGVTGYLACGLAPNTNRIYFDEHIYMHIGQAIAHTGRAESANYARAEYGQFELFSGWVNKQPNGFPYLLSWFYKVFGVSEAISHVANRVFIGLGTAALYLALTLVPWLLPRGAAIAAAILFAFTPLVMWWGHTAAVEPSAALTAVVAFLAACIHAKLRDPVTGQGQIGTSIFVGATVAFACYFRPESMLVYPMALAVYWASDVRLLKDPKTWATAALAIALTTPQLLHIWSMHTENWGATDGRRFDVDFLAANFRSNAGYFVNSKWFPIGGTILGIVGLYYLKRTNSRAAAAVGLWFLMSWGIFVTFYAGGYYYGASSRYGVVSCAPIAVAMGIGFTAIWEWTKLKRALCIPLLIALVMNWVTAMHYVPTIARESAEARADIDFIARIAPTLPEGSLVLANDPCVWNVYGRNSSQVFTLEDMVRTNLNELRREYPGGIYLHWNFWHNVEKSLEPVARKLVQDTHAVVVARQNSQNHQLALLRLDTPEAMAKFGGPPTPPREIPNLDDVLSGRSAAPSTK